MTRALYGNRIGRQGKLTVGCSAAIFDMEGKKILLIRRADNGRWAVPGGYMEAGESVNEGCAREVLEETGLSVRVVRLVGVYTNPNMLVTYPDGNAWQIVVLYFLAEVSGGELLAGDDAIEAGFYSLEEIARMDLRPIDRQRVADVFAGREAAFIRDDVLVE